MKHVKNMFVVIASLATMGLFSFRNANTNGEAVKKVNVTTYASCDNVSPVHQVYLRKTIIKETAPMIKVSLIAVQENESTTNDVTAKSQALLANL